MKKYSELMEEIEAGLFDKLWIEGPHKEIYHSTESLKKTNDNVCGWNVFVEINGYISQFQVFDLVTIGEGKPSKPCDVRLESRGSYRGMDETIPDFLKGLLQELIFLKLQNPTSQWTLQSVQTFFKGSEELQDDFEATYWNLKGREAIFRGSDENGFGVYRINLSPRAEIGETLFVFFNAQIEANLLEMLRNKKPGIYIEAL